MWCESQVLEEELFQSPVRTTETNWWCCGQEVNYPGSSSDRCPTQEIELGWSPLVRSVCAQKQVGDLMLQKPRGTQCGHHWSCRGLRCAKIERKVQDGIWMPKLYYNSFCEKFAQHKLELALFIINIFAHFIPKKTDGKVNTKQTNINGFIFLALWYNQ